MPQWTVEVIQDQLSSELRRSVLRPHYAVGATLPGDDEPGVVHLGAFVEAGEDRVLASACLIFPEQCPWLPEATGWRLRSMATDPAWRGSGAGSQILSAAKQISADAGATVLWCQARQPAIAFYRRNGFAEFGELFDTELGPHRRMWTRLTD